MKVRESLRDLIFEAEESYRHVKVCHFVGDGILGHHDCYIVRLYQHDVETDYYIEHTRDHAIERATNCLRYGSY